MGGADRGKDVHGMDRLVRGEHPDPFSLLGIQRLEDGSRGVRCYFPGAEAVSLLDASGRELGTLAPVHPRGVFQGPLPARRRHYRLRVSWPGGSCQDLEDPYRFPPTLGELDRHLLGEGAHQRLWTALGARQMSLLGVQGTRFAVWAPGALRVSVVGEFNGWDGRRHAMRRDNASGTWELFVPGVGHGALYKFELLDARGRLLPTKSDPLGQYFEPPPGNAGVVYTSRYRWQDGDWMARRQAGPGLDRPVSIYEVHLGSWRHRQDGDSRPLSYRELARELVDYVVDMGFTHVEFLPVSEHPFAGSWGYQPLGMYAPTHRFGEPDDFRYLVDCCHRAGIGVIVDWVPAHFPKDEHGLARFDGTALYEHEDPRLGEHPDWGTLIFNYGRNEVVNYLIASALYWVEEFHVDGLRVDAVASMLYLDYSRKPGQWLPNRYGGNENLEAVSFLQRMNTILHQRGATTYAEESTAWPGVSRPTYTGGLGFTYKWNMGWMHDTLGYMREDPVHRRHHHDRMTFSMVYAYSENFVLPLSHDEVVHGKGSLLGKMPGDEWQRLANLRAYLASMYCHPGKKLLFMGAELAQYREWNHDAQLDWQLLAQPGHRGMQALVRKLNAVYRTRAALHALDFDTRGFEWIEADDAGNSVLAWLRTGPGEQCVICVCNFTPVVRHGYRIGVPRAGRYRELLNTDAHEFGGSGVGNPDLPAAEEIPSHGHRRSLALTLPPLATLILEPVAPDGHAKETSE